MNYIEQIKGFWLANEEHSFSTTDIALYFYLLEVNNICAWKENFRRNNNKIMASLGITYKTLHSARQRLKNCGLISFTTKNGSPDVTYNLWNFSKGYVRSSAEDKDEVVDDDSRNLGKNSKGCERGLAEGEDEVTAKDKNEVMDKVVDDRPNLGKNSKGCKRGLAEGEDEVKAEVRQRFGMTKDKLNQTKLNQTNYLSLSAESSKKEKERERICFLEFLFFEKSILNPSVEVDRFIAHYEKTGWLDANGNSITNKLAALKTWKTAGDLQKIPSNFTEKWRELYEAAKAECGKYELMISGLRGYKIEPSGLKLKVTKELHNFIEDPEIILVIRPAYMRVFPNLNLGYECVK